MSSPQSAAQGPSHPAGLPGSGYPAVNQPSGPLPSDLITQSHNRAGFPQDSSVPFPSNNVGDSPFVSNHPPAPPADAHPSFSSSSPPPLPFATGAPTSFVRSADGGCGSAVPSLRNSACSLTFNPPPPRPAPAYIVGGPLPGLPQPSPAASGAGVGTPVSPAVVPPPHFLHADEGPEAGPAASSATPITTRMRSRGTPLESSRVASPFPGASGRLSVVVPTACGSRGRYMHCLAQRSAAWMMFNKGVQSVEPQCVEYISSWIAMQIGAIGRQAKIYANIRGTNAANYFDIKQALFDVCPFSYAALFRTTGIEPVAGTQPKEVLLGGRKRRGTSHTPGASPPEDEDAVIMTDDSWLYRGFLGDDEDMLTLEEAGAASLGSSVGGAPPIGGFLDSHHEGAHASALIGDDASRVKGTNPSRGGGSSFLGAASATSDFWVGLPHASTGSSGVPGGGGSGTGITSHGDTAAGAGGGCPGEVPGGGVGGPEGVGSGSGFGTTAAGKGNTRIGGWGPPLHVPPWLPQFPPAHLWRCTPTPSLPAADALSLDFKRQCAKMELQLNLPQLQLPQIPPHQDEGESDGDEGKVDDEQDDDEKRKKAKRIRFDEGSSGDLLWGSPPAGISRGREAHEEQVTGTGARGDLSGRAGEANPEEKERESKGDRGHSGSANAEAEKKKLREELEGSETRSIAVGEGHDKGLPGKRNLFVEW
ncbi:transcription initiation factor tfiid complex subunit taf8 [Cystoisospora suis]|uniref:Transcription initiation factor tfiid complex subunit taf8 n=1 Tax=Cystoisospora suis TaxID=483139 RepID=A0A2C6LDK8_9APIC|nr:transcription initiation factor tfiid complex subunit taf8 [Cystoisospora suis]